ncbi:hypothetical protein BC829DRAFT_8345 [Chytridium lagenaria]|nr:hypothetical protein BC829DRAFT_8345 [Chytridium lagenaria]
MREFEYDSENEEILYSNEHEAPSPVSTKGTPRNLLDLRMTPNSDILNEIAPLIPGLQNIDFNHRAQAGAPQPLFRDRVQFDHTPSPHQRREMSPSPPPHGRSKSPPVMPRPKNYISRYASRSPTPREAPKHPSPPQSDFTNVAHGMSSPIDISDGRGNRHYEEMKALQGTRELDHQFGYFNYSPRLVKGGAGAAHQYHL